MLGRYIIWTQNQNQYSDLVFGSVAISIIILISW